MLGRSFSLKDLHSIKLRLGSDEKTATPRCSRSRWRPAIAAGLLVEHPAGSPADYSFTHDQVREFAAALLTAARRRAIHTALVDMLSADGDPPAESMSLLAHHALAGDEPERAVRYSISAAQAALDARAAEEVLRIVDQALPAASAAQDRVALLACKGRRPRHAPAVCRPARGPLGARCTGGGARRLRIWGSTSSCAGLPHFASPRTRSRPPSCALWCATRRTSAATGPPSWPRASSWGRT